MPHVRDTVSSITIAVGRTVMWRMQCLLLRPDDRRARPRQAPGRALPAYDVGPQLRDLWQPPGHLPEFLVRLAAVSVGARDAAARPVRRADQGAIPRVRHRGRAGGR